MILIQSQVVFNEENHTYTLNGKELHGITGMLSRQLFPDKYKDIPDHILKKAAERGTAIHKDCEFADVTGLDPQTTEGLNYLELRKKYTVIANEYTVSDNEYYASNIDCVWSKDGEITLADIKTTSKLDKEYIQWQLSIYAYLFELQNPHIKVSHLCGVWLRDETSELIEVERIPIEEILKLLECEKAGTNYLPVKEEKMLIANSAIQTLIEAKQLAEMYNKQYKEIENSLLQAMVAHGVKSWEIDSLKATYTPPSESTTFDTKRFQEEHPELYKEYLKKSPRKETIRITLR